MKASLVAQICAHVAAELEALDKSAQAAYEGATHEQSKPENKYDTRGLEASYLAGAQRERAAELRVALHTLNAQALKSFAPDAVISLTALVELETGGVRSLCFLMSLGAGYPLILDGRPVMTVTPHAPLGEALVGKIAGDLVSIRTAAGMKEYEIIGVE